jgi:hypothetical protein
MIADNVETIAKELNERAENHSIGNLQKIRTKLKNLSRRPGNNIFSSQTTFENYAFHHGGRAELQFNIGFGQSNDKTSLRFGIAFSLKTSQSLPNIDILLPKIRLFNEFIRQDSEQYEDMRMWNNKNDLSNQHVPSPIPPEFVTEGNFIFLGKLKEIDQIDYNEILTVFDRLLPLYLYVESDGESYNFDHQSDNFTFEFRPGHTEKALYTKATPAQKELDVNLNHNLLQKALYKKLSSKFGAENVGTELPSGVGKQVDLIVQNDGEYWFYEIKTCTSPRICLRQAIGQLLEYAYWPASQEAKRLIVVGKSELDEDGKEYLSRLRQKFSLPIRYEQVSVQ